MGFTMSSANSWLWRHYATNRTIRALSTSRIRWAAPTSLENQGLVRIFGRLKPIFGLLALVWRWNSKVLRILLETDPWGAYRRISRPKIL
jgi:hypothetical protein